MGPVLMGQATFKEGAVVRRTKIALCTRKKRVTRHERVCLSPQLAGNPLQQAQLLSRQSPQLRPAQSVTTPTVGLQDNFYGTANQSRPVLQIQ